MSKNVEDLKNFVKTLESGETAEVATSQYATNTTPVGYSFDYHSTAQAVRSLVKQRLITADYRWRYFEITKV